MKKLYAFIVEFLNNLNWLWVIRILLKALIPVLAYCIIFATQRWLIIFLAIMIIVYSLAYYVMQWQKYGENWKKIK